MSPSADEMHAILIGLSVVGVAAFVFVWVGVVIYDRRRLKRETHRLQVFADSKWDVENGSGLISDKDVYGGRWDVR